MSILRPIMLKGFFLIIFFISQQFVFSQIEVRNAQNKTAIIDLHFDGNVLIFDYLDTKGLRQVIEAELPLVGTGGGASISSFTFNNSTNNLTIVQEDGKTFVVNLNALAGAGGTSLGVSNGLSVENATMQLGDSSPTETLGKFINNRYFNHNGQKLIGYNGAQKLYSFDAAANVSFGNVADNFSPGANFFNYQNSSGTLWGGKRNFQTTAPKRGGLSWGEDLIDEGYGWNATFGYNNKVQVNPNLGTNAFANLISGRNNEVYGSYATLLGGQYNKSSNGYSNVIFGYSNKIESAFNSCILAGTQNLIKSQGYGNVILTGERNRIEGPVTDNPINSVILAGSDNLISTNWVTLIGKENVISRGAFSFVVGTGNQIASNSHSFILGYNIKLNTDGAYNMLCGTSLTGGAKSVYTSIGNGYLNKIDGAHNTITNGQINEIVSDASSFHGFNLISNGEQHKIDRTQFTSILNGYGIYSSSYMALYHGKNNALNPFANRTAWEPKDDLFVIGNGEYLESRSNVLTFIKKGWLLLNASGTPQADYQPKAALEIRSTNSGVLFPSLTQAQVDSMPNENKLEGLTIWNSSTKKIQTYDGTQWVNHF